MHISCIPSCASCVPYHLSIMAFVPIEPFSHAYYTATNQLSTSSELCSVILWRASGTCSRFIIHIIITTFFWNHFPSSAQIQPAAASRDPYWPFLLEIVFLFCSPVCELFSTQDVIANLFCIVIVWRWMINIAVTGLLIDTTATESINVTNDRHWLGRKAL